MIQEYVGIATEGALLCDAKLQKFLVLRGGSTGGRGVDGDPQATVQLHALSQHGLAGAGRAGAGNAVATFCILNLAAGQGLL